MMVMMTTTTMAGDGISCHDWGQIQSISHNDEISKTISKTKPNQTKLNRFRRVWMDAPFYSVRWVLALHLHANIKEMVASVLHCMAMVHRIKVNCLKHTIWRIYGNCRAFSYAKITITVCADDAVQRANAFFPFGM